MWKWWPKCCHELLETPSFFNESWELNTSNIKWRFSYNKHLLKVHPLHNITNVIVARTTPPSESGTVTAGTAIFFRQMACHSSHHRSSARKPRVKIVDITQHQSYKLSWKGVHLVWLSQTDIPPRFVRNPVKIKAGDCTVFRQQEIMRKPQAQCILGPSSGHRWASQWCLRIYLLFLQRHSHCDGWRSRGKLWQRCQGLRCQNG